MADETGGDGDGSNNVTRLDPQRKRPPKQETQPADVRAQRAGMVLGPNCPYVPLGYDNPDVYYVLDRNRLVKGLRPRDLSRNMMVAICGEPWLEQRYPRKRKGEAVYGIAAEKAAAELMEACSCMGFWNPDDHLRGLGAWVGHDGELILHRGDHLWSMGKTVPLGRYGDFVYVPRRPLPGLPKLQGELTKTAAQLVLSKLDTFRWSRGAYDADLALGWICCAMLGAALEQWRPHLWIGADANSGKTTLQNLLIALFSPAGIVSTTDTTGAGLWQQIGCDCIPIGVDEIESTAEQGREQAIVKLLRQASSGALIMRGGSSHIGASFTVKSAFLCTSVIVPPLAAQDASRIVGLELFRDPPGTFRPLPDFEQMATIGAALMSRLADQYPRLVRLVLPAVRQQMIDAGFSTRLADVHAPLWACRDVANHDEFAAARLADWLAKPLTVAMREQALAQARPEYGRCLDWLASSRIDRIRPESDTFGDVIALGSETLLNPPTRFQANLFDKNGNEIVAEGEDSPSVAARNRLQRFGLQLGVDHDQESGERQVVLRVASQHRALAEIFQTTAWRTLPEAATGGGWAQVLRRAPGAYSTKHQIRFRNVRSRATVIPIGLVLGLDDRPPAPPTDTEMEEQQARPGDAVH